MVFDLQDELPMKVVPMEEGLDVTKSISDDVSVPMVTTGESADGYVKGVCR